MQFKIKSIESRFFKKVREKGLDDLNQRVVYLIAQGGEPCRDVLRRAKKGEKLILASYCPFKRSGPYKEYGPIFVLEEENKKNLIYNELPLSKNLNQDYLKNNFVLRAYNKEEIIVDAKVVEEENSLDVLYGFLKNKEIDFILARFTAYGCYALRIEKD
ncbi:MAG: hypothetical protein COA66_02415 [Arcobacter sp.]|nr:MAG: hypothetical protein COA66_02415 [Arcobacter sp.]